MHWYQAPASLKLMIDRLVCADGGNPDPTTTRGKDPAAAKALELAGWPYPRHLAGRGFAVVTHGDSQGHEGVRAGAGRMAGGHRHAPGRHVRGASIRSIGYYEPYATSHDKLDAQPETFVQVENAAKSLARLVRDMRSGKWRAPDAELKHPRQK